MRNILKISILVLVSFLMANITLLLFAGIGKLVELIPFNEPLMWAIFFIGGAGSIITLFIMNEREG